MVVTAVRLELNKSAGRQGLQQQGTGWVTIIVSVY